MRLGPDVCAVLPETRVVQLEDGFQIFNPGSPTERRRAPTHTTGLATIADGRIAFEHVHLP